MGHLNLNVKQATGLTVEIKPPVVLTCSPIHVNIAGGNVATIGGKNFYPGAQATIDGIACTGEVVLSRTSMTVITPAHAEGGPFNIVVTNPLGGDGHGLSGTGVGLISYVSE